MVFKKTKYVYPGKGKKKIPIQKEKAPSKGKGKAPTPPTQEGNVLKGANGADKDNVLPGIYVDDSIYFALVHKVCQFQRWLKFFQLHCPISPEDVITFYKGLSITYDDNEVEWRFNLGGIKKVYNQIDFYKDFGVETVISHVRDENSTESEEFRLMRDVKRFNSEKIPPGWKHGNAGKVIENETGKNVPKYAKGNRHCLDGEDYLLLMLIRRGITPVNNNDAEVTKYEVSLFLKLKDRKRVSLPQVIANHMNYTLTDKRGKSLPYGMFVSFLMRKWGIAQGEVDPKLKPSWFSIANLSHFSLRLLEDPLQHIVRKEDHIVPLPPQDDQPRDEAGPSSSAPPRRSASAPARRSSASASSSRKDIRETRQMHREISRQNETLLHNQGIIARALKAFFSTCKCKGDQPVEGVHLELRAFEEPVPHPDTDEDDDGGQEDS